MRVNPSFIVFLFFELWTFILALKTDKGNPIFIIFLLVVGLLRTSGNLTGGWDLSSLWLLLNIALLILIYLKNMAIYSGFILIVSIYWIYIFYTIINTIPKLGETTSLEFSVRMLLKQIYPLLALMVAEKLFRKKEYLDLAVSKTLLVTFIVSLFIGGFSAKYENFIMWSVRRFTWADAAFSDHSAIITSLALIWWSATQKKEYLFLAIWLCASTILLRNRTGIAATAIGISFFILLRYGIMRALPFLVALYIAGMSVLFLSPELQQHMFYNPEKVNAANIIRNPTDIDFDTINSSGRFEMWEYLLNKFWRPHPLTGSGLGAVQGYLYSSKKWSGLSHPHSSYVKVLCDSGLIGLFLFILIHLSCMLSAYRILKGTSNEYARVAAGFVICAVPSLFIIMGFDSAINCATAVMQYSFIFSGIMIGLSRQENEESSI